MAAHLQEKLSQMYYKKTKMNYSIMPSKEEVYENPTEYPTLEFKKNVGNEPGYEYYNSILYLHTMAEHSDLNVMMDN